MWKTVVGLFESMDKASNVKKMLLAEGLDASSIRVLANNEEVSATANESGYTDIGSGGGTGIGEKIGSFFRSLAGGDDDTHHHYANGVNGGGALLAVTCEDGMAPQMATMLKQHGAKEIENSNEGLGAFTPGSQETSDTEQTMIPIVEESLAVGKREVDRGGVRVYSHLVERPVEADVTLRNERVVVERRPVDRAATAADFSSGKESVIEMTAMGEEAVVGKSSRVVEEVLVGKEATEHTEQIHETLRRTEVESTLR